MEFDDRISRYCQKWWDNAFPLHLELQLFFPSNEAIYLSYCKDRHLEIQFTGNGVNKRLEGYRVSHTRYARANGVWEGIHHTSSHGLMVCWLFGLCHKFVACEDRTKSYLKRMLLWMWTVCLNLNCGSILVALYDLQILTKWNKSLSHCLCLGHIFSCPRVKTYKDTYPWTCVRVCERTCV